MRPEAHEAATEASKTEVTAKAEPARAEPGKPLPKRRPKLLVEAVTLLAGDTSEGKVNLGALGSYLRRADPAFSPKTYGHSGLLDMVKTYDLLSVKKDDGGSWMVSLATKGEAAGVGARCRRSGSSEIPPDMRFTEKSGRLTLV